MPGEWRRTESVVVSSDEMKGGSKAYQALENTGAICCNTGRNVPQLVLELGKLELLSDFFWAQVWNKSSVKTRPR